MASRIVIDGNAFYEIDEDCMRRRREQQGERYEREQKEQKRQEGSGRIRRGHNGR